MRRHRLDLLSLVSGLLLVAGAAVWTAWERGALSTGELLLVLPGTLVVLGGAGMAASLLAPHRGAVPAAENDTETDTETDTERISS